MLDIYIWNWLRPDMFLAQDDMAGLIGGTICISLLALALGIAIALCVWIYRDAESRGMNGALWVVILIVMTIFLNIIGTIIAIVVYLLVRTPKQAPLQPMQYGAPPYGAPPPSTPYGTPPPSTPYGTPPPSAPYSTPPSAPGYSRPPTPTMATNCRYCGAQIPPGSTICPRCGGSL